ncbi:3-oxoacyl-[acyl-carrier protein] reductase [Leucobacter sp. 7(1)]|uniref:SDR family NAD(P)-dependent oxidoreductase n=1 Tax=Leucobacter sp. 7(1) TaxID=1255613 RepID=UPI00097F30C5|nr:SDR family NAD(P)-dependent oxidoreductase [Leucobacter sp. 7(1)]SJN09722.1 3-oxoacyl-[acyl-carrier protein] reductase [Leucobacter sp. 7(1)]
MGMDYLGKVAFVTGAASGIGAAITELLLERGASVIASDLSADALSPLVEAHGDRVFPVEIDVTDESTIEAGLEAGVGHFGHLDCAFNIAGVSRGAMIVDLPAEQWDLNNAVVLRGVFLSVKHEARVMRERGGGAIVNMSSLNARMPMHTGAAYSSAKAGVEMFTKSAALELAEWGIRVNAVLPGLIDTPLTQRRLLNAPLMDSWLPRIPLGRPGLPLEVAQAALFLAGPEASYVTGTGLIVDGGWEITGYPDLRPFS